MSVRDKLNQEYQTIKGTLPRYSKRQFAKKIGVSPSFLHRILSGEKDISEKRAFEIGQRLNWSKQKIEEFINLVRLQKSNSESFKSFILESANNYPNDSKSDSEPSEYFSKSYDEEKFKVVSEWHYGAIFAAFNLANFNVTIKNVSKKFGLDPVRCEIALDRLERLGFIKKIGNSYAVSEKKVFFGNVPSRYIRRFHKQMLQKADQALERQPFEQRDFSGLTVAIDPENIEIYKKEIAKFRSKIRSLANKDQAKNVMHLSIQLFSLENQHSNSN